MTDTVITDQYIEEVGRVWVVSGTVLPTSRTGDVPGLAQPPAATGSAVNHSQMRVEFLQLQQLQQTNSETDDL